MSLWKLGVGLFISMLIYLNFSYFKTGLFVKAGNAFIYLFQYYYILK